MIVGMARSYRQEDRGHQEDPGSGPYGEVVYRSPTRPIW